MLISHKNKFIFIHIYKTAGTSVTHLFVKNARLIDRLVYYYKPSRLAFNYYNTLMGWHDLGNKPYTGFHKHEKAVDIKRKLGQKIYESFFTFAFVRNPFDWLVSLFFYIQQSPHHRFHKHVIRMKFDEFAGWYIANHYPRQIDFVTDQEENIIIDHIGKLETLEADIQHITRKLGIRYDAIPRENISSKRRGRDFRQFYDSRTYENVQRYFQQDLIAFNYL